MRAPTTNAITQGQHGNYNAVDYSPYPDPNIYAPEDGTVSVFTDPTCGNAMHLQGATGRHGFCHLETYAVRSGSVVKGQILGKMGYTGYTIPSGPGGRHLHWVLYRNGAYVYPPTLVNETGDSMSTTDLGLARVLAHGILGRNGHNGKPNALDGSQDADLIKNHVGKETNAKIWEFYNSAEGKDWRDNLQPKAYAERDALKRQVVEITTDRDGLIVKYDTEKAKVAELTESNNQLQITVNEQKQQIKDLEAQIASHECPTNPECPTGWQAIRQGLRDLLGIK